MSTAVQTPLASLAALSKVDAAIFALISEKKRVEQSLQERRNALAKRDAERKSREQVLNDKRKRYSRDEKTLNDERQKIVDRRKALSSFGNYKIQQAAQREIDASAEALGNQEEALIGELEVITAIEKEYESFAGSIDETRKELVSFEADSLATIKSLEERSLEKTASRDEILSSIDQNSLTSYRKVSERYPQNPVVAVVDKACSGCFMTLVAQVAVQVSRGDVLVKCPGCGRILCLPEHLAAQTA